MKHICVKCRHKVVYGTDRVPDWDAGGYMAIEPVPLRCSNTKGNCPNAGPLLDVSDEWFVAVPA